MATTTLGRPAIRMGGILIPAEAATSLDAFRLWARSEEFPERGRIDYLQGTIEVDMTPERLESHGIPKTELVAYIHRIVKGSKAGRVFSDRARLSSPDGQLSCEPDVLFVSWESLESGRARYVGPSPDDLDAVEIEGAADLAVEVVSKRSVGKDAKRLPPLYAKAGVRELWLVDARTLKRQTAPPPRFQVLHLHEGAYRTAAVDAEGFQESRVLGRRLRLRREPARLPDTWDHFVDEAPVFGQQTP
jgi:Uma2 family endonuclease